MLLEFYWTWVSFFYMMDFLGFFLHDEKLFDSTISRILTDLVASLGCSTAGSSAC